MAKWTEFSFILKPSSLGGVGVFSTHDFAVGDFVFAQELEKKIRKIKDIPTDFLKYCIYLNDEECTAPERFDRMEVGWYINHSDMPNIAITENKDVMVVREIKAGDEILIDYNQLNEPEHMKEAYYKHTS